MPSLLRLVLHRPVKTLPYDCTRTSSPDRRVTSYEQFSLLLDRDIGLLKHLKIFALLPLSDFRLEAFNLSALDEDIVINEFFSEYVSKESIVF
jgi:hypothetical protein